MNENGSKRRDWIKNAAIIFLTVMLVLTFFSNTIMNYSLPEVATQYVQRGTITAKIRGTGNVEATDPYNVMVKESRVISSVAVKQGDTVEKDQILYYLEDAESDELRKAEDELEDLELAYMKGLFGGTVSPEIINKVASGKTDSFASYQAKVTDMQNRLENAKNRVAECQKALDEVTLQSAINTNNAGTSTLTDELAKDQAATDLAKAQEAFNDYKAKKAAELTSEIAEVQKQIADLETLVSSAESIAGSVSGAATGGSGTGTGSGGGGTSATTTTTGGIDVYTQQRDAAAKVVDDKLKKIADAVKANDKNYSGGENISALRKWISDNKKDADYQTLLAEYDAAVAQYNITVNSFNEASGQLGGYESNKAALNSAKQRLTELQAKLAEVNAITVSSNESVQDAQSRLDQATRNITEITGANKQSSAAYQNKITNAEAALKNAQAVYELLKQEQTDLAADINAELDLSKASRDIAQKKEEIEKLKEKSMGAEIKAPVAGTVTSLTYAAGETTKPEEAAAVIQMEGKGFTVSFSVTNEQAKKVQTGDVAELQNAWYYDDAKAVLSAIRPDPESAGQKRLLVFDVTGSSIQAGQSLSLSVGQRSAEYELVVPNSAVREDSNGKFILIVESKSGPISNRYIATRVDVEVLASDDNNTAVSAGLYGNEYVITTSTKPVEAGKQVRLNEG